MPEMPWFAFHVNLAALWQWLDENGETPSDGPAYFMEKPWKWDSEWERFKASGEAEGIVHG